MKKIFIAVLVTFLTSLTKTADAQLKEGNTFVDFYYGFPDWQKYLMKDNFSYSGSKNIKVTSTGYFGARAEHMIAGRIGFGLDLWYANAKLAATRTLNQYDYDPATQKNTLLQTGESDVKQSLARVAVLGRIIVHLGSSATIDPYIHAGFGYVNYQYSYSSSNSLYNEEDKNFFPMAARAGFGMRIFLSKQLGANVDLGVGGPLFTLGATYKFSAKE